MNIYEVPLFPTLVMRFEDFLTEQQRQDIIFYTSSIEGISHNTLDGNALSTHTTRNNILSEISYMESCKDLKDMLYEALELFSKKTCITFENITNSWVNIQNKGSKLIQHTHPNAAISAGLYLNIEDESNALYFENPNPFISFSPTTVRRSEYTFDYFYLKPKNRDLFLFPSWLKHGSKDQENQTDNRIVLSFNAV